MRPKFHFTAQQHWLNDPNGLCYLEGEYHLFFQHNPLGDTPGNIGWGHAVSSNLLEWQELPMALPFDGRIMAFSGSVVIDHQGLAGFGVGAMVAVFTAHHTDQPLEAQHLAYSNDRGRTWHRYAGNPVLDIGKKDFRDPKVFWHEPEGRFIMLLALPNERQVQFYGSSDLKTWQYLSTFGPAGQSAGIWEVPDLLELPFEGKSQWVLKVDVGSNGLFGGSGGQYFVGHFDGQAFTAESNAWIDGGKDFYAALSFAGTERHLWLAWHNNWQYAQTTPTSPWRGCMTLPRELRLVRSTNGVRLAQMPVPELQATRASPNYHQADLALQDQTLELPISGAHLDIKLECSLSQAQSLALCVAVGSGCRTIIGYEPATQQCYLDRRESGDVDFSPDFAGKHHLTVPLEANRLQLRVVLDGCSLEVFVQGGVFVFSDLIFPSPEAQNLELVAQGKVVINTLSVWKL